MTTYDDWITWGIPEGETLPPHARSADVCAPADKSGRCDVCVGVNRCAFDAGHDGPCRTIMGLLQ